jgi:hypothetical protein
MNSESSGKLIRTVGFWGLVAMCINAVVGSGVFLLPHESFKLLGPFSLWAPLIFALPVFILALCFAEAASHFTEPGGAYLYAKTAFGDFIGFETGFMNWIARVSSLAALSNGFVVSLALFAPSLKNGAPRAGVIVASIVILAGIHYVGVKYGAASIYIFTVGKMLPLVGFIVLALIVWKTNPIPQSLTIPTGDVNWTPSFICSRTRGSKTPTYRGQNKNLARILHGSCWWDPHHRGSMPRAARRDPRCRSVEDGDPIASAAAEIIGPIGAIIVTIGALMDGGVDSERCSRARACWRAVLGRRACLVRRPAVPHADGGDRDPRDGRARAGAGRIVRAVSYRHSRA